MPLPKWPSIVGFWGSLAGMFRKLDHLDHTKKRHSSQKKQRHVSLTSSHRSFTLSPFWNFGDQRAELYQIFCDAKKCQKCRSCWIHECTRSLGLEIVTIFTSWVFLKIGYVVLSIPKSKYQFPMILGSPSFKNPPMANIQPALPWKVETGTQPPEDPRIKAYKKQIENLNESLQAWKIYV
jgi:hypothetical protein